MSFLPKGLLVKSNHSANSRLHMPAPFPCFFSFPCPIVPEKHFLRGNSHEHSRHSGARVSE